MMHETCVIPRANIHRLACALLFLCLSHATSVFGQNVFYEPLSAKTERIIAPATIKFELPLLPSATPNTASMATMGVSGDPNDSFDNWYRYPAEERQWLVMDNVPSNPTSYYRDVETGAQTINANAVDGDYYEDETDEPDGTVLKVRITYYENYNGMQKCFIDQYGYGVCGSNNITILWY